jgi:biotin carboxyl carrier protein
MKYLVKVSDKTYEVDIGDLNSRPIIAFIEGEAIEVWLEVDSEIGPQGNSNILTNEKQIHQGKIPAIPQAVSQIGIEQQRSKNESRQEITAPIPGVIIAILVNEGDFVEYGQELCVLEAMKMKNTIRASKSGKITKVNIDVGKAVHHRALLFEVA